MNAISYRGYAATVAFDPEDEIFTGRLASLNDVVGFHADNVSDLKTAFHEAVDDYIATCAKIGKEPERPYSGKVMFRVDPAVHANAALAAQLGGKSLNQWAEAALSDAARRDISRVVPV